MGLDLRHSSRRLQTSWKNSKGSRGRDWRYLRRQVPTRQEKVGSHTGWKEVRGLHVPGVVDGKCDQGLFLRLLWLSVLGVLLVPMLCSQYLFVKAELRLYLQRLLLLHLDSLHST